METELTVDRVIQSRGRPVSIGTAERGLAREDALEVVRLARDERRALAGGDVYLDIAGRIEPAYANWHVDVQPGEHIADYQRRSWDEAAEYISRYPAHNDGNPLFVLVFAEA